MDAWLAAVDAPFAAARTAVDGVAASAGVPAPAFRLLVSLLAQYPMALLMIRLPRGAPAAAKHLYGGGLGLAVCVFNYGFEMYHALVTVLATWLLLRLAPRGAAVGAAFAFNFGYLLVGYYFTSTDDYDIDWTLPQCVLCLRLIGLAFDVFDGGKPRAALRTDQLRNHIVAVPGLLETFGYAFFFASVLTGPQFPLRRYREFVHGHLFDQVDQRAVPMRLIRRAARAAAAKRFALGVVYLAVANVGGQFFPASLLGELDTMSYWQAFYTVFIVAHLGLRKYLGVWLITEGSCILTGMSAIVEPGQKKITDVAQIQWHGLANVLPSIFETAWSVNDLISAFNINTNDWAKRYIFKRLIFLGNKNLSTLGTLAFLSIWHGFSWGYAQTFATEFLSLLCLARIAKRHAQLGLANKKLYAWLVLYPLTMIIAAHGYVPFETLTRPKTFAMFNRLGWPVHSALLAYLLAELALDAVGLGAPDPKKQQTKKVTDAKKPKAE